MLIPLLLIGSGGLLFWEHKRQQAALAVAGGAPPPATSTTPEATPVSLDKRDIGTSHTLVTGGAGQRAGTQLGALPPPVTKARYGTEPVATAKKELTAAALLSPYFGVTGEPQAAPSNTLQTRNARPAEISRDDVS